MFQSFMQTEYKIFVGGFCDKTTRDDLIIYFSQFGELQSALIIMDKYNNSRGFGFVTFKFLQAMNNAIIFIETSL
jgi:RNA recognition motif-containing protein